MPTPSFEHWLAAQRARDRYGVPHMRKVSFEAEGPWILHLSLGHFTGCTSADRELSPLVGLAARKAKPRLAGIADHVPRARIATTVDRRRKYASDARPDCRCQNCGELYRGKRCKDCGFAPVSIDDAGADRQRVGARANRDWSGPADDRDFKRDILPGLQGITLRRIMEATGLSKRFASQIRNGLAVPHRRHWDALLVLLER
jgi:hypothetical protein